MPPLAAPAESPSTSSTRTHGRHAESTHRTPLLDRQTLPDAAPARPGTDRYRPCAAWSARVHARPRASRLPASLAR
ncbi:hypothetical protein DN051_10675 [Streptomyces cadmiisoli]|uniref:Uncharacterized protein n=1 Tax=Streptomyces cadmiisoli TaxID=2184053 RepID=A0A2Z4IWR8_9ACTN|nr:hypothetical protein DN051_10675 [Streptomyces cadmiisoli]